MNYLIYLSFIFLTITQPIVISQMIQIFIFIVFIFKRLKLKFTKKDIYIYIWLLYLFLSLIFFKELNLKNLKTIVGYGIYLLSFYFYMKSKDLEYLIKQYIRLSLFFCTIGIIQEIGYLLNINEIYNLNLYGFAIKNSYSGYFLRIASFFTETVHFGLFIIPAYFLYIYSEKNQSVKILYWVCILFTFSLVNYFVFFTFILIDILFFKKLTLINIVKKGMLLILIPLLFFLIYLSVPIVNEKLNTLLFYKNYNIFKEGGSAYSIISLFQISWSAFKENFIFGGGFLSTAKNYEKYILDYYSTDKGYISQDVYYFKLFGELGLLGAFFYGSLLKKFYNKRLIYSKIVLVGILLVNLRIGAYLYIPTSYLLALYLRIGSEKKEQN